MQNENLTFNDLPQVVAQLRDEVMGMKAMLSRQQAENSKPVKENRHVLCDLRRYCCTRRNQHV